MRFIDLKTQYESIREDVGQRIQAVLEHGQYILGPEVSELEAQLAEYVGVTHCVTMSSGTDALVAALMALGVGAGDEVITTPFSFIASAEVIALVGATPVFVDIDHRTYNLDPDLLEAAITPLTKAIIPVSLYGQCAALDDINAIAARHELPVIEDAAQSFGATYKGRQSCGLSTIGCTSFFPSKPLGAYGDAGACFTNDDMLAETLKQLRVHGQDRRYHHPLIGINGRMDSIQAAVLLAKLQIFPKEVELRQVIGQTYTDLLKDHIHVPFIESHNTSVYAQYTIEVDQRDTVQETLSTLDIPTAVHYPVPLNLQPAFSYLALSADSFPNAVTASQRVMSLPMHPYLDAHTIEKIVEALLAC